MNIFLILNLSILISMVMFMTNFYVLGKVLRNIYGALFAFLRLR